MTQKNRLSATNPIKVQGTNFESGVTLISALHEARAVLLTKLFVVILLNRMAVFQLFVGRFGC